MGKEAAFDFCKLQRLINSIGGSDEFPAYEVPAIRHHGERIMQYGLTCKQYCEIDPLPALPGVYSISALQLSFSDGKYHSVGSEHLLYIGSSQCIRTRLYNNHPWYGKVHGRFFDLDRVVIVRYRITPEYKWMERSLIRTLRPLFNIHHNG